MSGVLVQDVRRDADADDRGHCKFGRDPDKRICHRSSSRSVVMTVSWFTRPVASNSATVRAVIARPRVIMRLGRNEMIHAPLPSAACSLNWAVATTRLRSPESSCRQ